MCLDLEHAIICMSQILGSIHVTGVSAYLVFEGLCFFFFFPFPFATMVGTGFGYGLGVYAISDVVLFFVLFPLSFHFTYVDRTLRA